MKRLAIIMITLLLVAGCLPGAPDNAEQEEVVENETSEEVVISRDINTSERYYRSILPYTPGASRGLILSGMDNRLDIDEFETGLMRLAQDSFDPDKYFFREGQILEESEIQAWIDRRSEDNPAGLNQELGVSESASVEEKLAAHKKNPKYLSYVLEQNYLVKKADDKVELGGIAVGLSLNSIYSFTVEDEQGRLHSGEVDLRSQSGTLIEVGKRMAEQIVNFVRKKDEAKNVPIMIAIYQEQTRDSLIPGRFLAMTTVGSGKTDISSWQNLNERHYLFPSEDVLEDHREDAEKFNNFKLRIEDFFPNFTGVIGKGFYKDGELQRLSIDISMQFYGKAEVIAFTQFVTDLIDEEFFPDLPIEVTISSVEKQESVIVKDPDMEEPYVQIYR